MADTHIHTSGSTDSADSGMAMLAFAFIAILAVAAFAFFAFSGAFATPSPADTGTEINVTVPGTNQGTTTPPDTY